MGVSSGSRRPPNDDFRAFQKSCKTKLKMPDILESFFVIRHSRTKKKIIFLHQACSWLHEDVLCVP